ncbi:MAG: Gfo/Idh/MocA family oxidoreductase [Planctomycetaceae bacterium]|jgi:predicted dehydrogenase|nr:Gfo/Idh/MocA family oxidoreductase [Planctomycetaceae bacterium]
MNMKLTRRHFLSAAALTSAMASFPAPAIFGAEKGKKYRVALVGAGGMGNANLEAAISTKTVKTVALVDVDRECRESTFETVKNNTGEEPKLFNDHQEMLEAVKPEIVIVATPEHWHPLIMIDACNSGAHVYLEKPVSHTVNEGIAMVKTARATGRTVQVGTHRRCSAAGIAAKKYIKEGNIGRIGMARAFVHYAWGRRDHPTPDAPTPEGLDWNRWCGPAPLVPFNPEIHPGGFRQFLNYGTGQLGDWGTHWMDMILWVMDDQEQFPSSVTSIGGRFLWRDNTDAPDTQSALYRFDKYMIEWEHRCYAGNAPEKEHIGVYFYGTKGTVFIGDGTWCVFKNQNNDAVPETPETPDNEGNIEVSWRNFIHCIENGQKPICDIEYGHRATTMTLLGMVSLKLGRSIAWNGEKQTIPNDPEAVKLLSREYRSPWKYPQ